MKTNSKYIVISALITLALTTLGLDSCVKDQFDESLGDLVTITLTAENPGFASDAAPASKSVVGDSIATPAASFAPVELDSTATLEESIAALGDRVVYSDSTMYICAPQGMAPDTKTGMTTGGVPFWEPGDKIGAVVKSGSTWSVASLSSNITAPAQNSTFTGKLTLKGKVHTLWTYYPYSSSVNFNKDMTTQPVDLNLPSNQTPKRSSSFDGKADIMIAQKIQFQNSYTPDFTNPTDAEKLIFHRKVGFMKFRLYDSNRNPLNKLIKKLTVTSTKGLVGTISFDLADPMAKIGTLPSGKTVTVSYGTETNPDVLGSMEVFAAVCPQDLSGVTLTIDGTTTDGTTFHKKSTIPAGNSIAANMYTFFGIVVETGGEVTPPTPDPDPTPGEISKTDAWQNFLDTDNALKTESNPAKRNDLLANRILLDYSYAGYHRGESVPAESDPNSFNGTVYNIAQMMDKLSSSQKKDKISDARQAFIKAINMHNSSSKRGMFYFPTGTYNLHDANDNEGNLSVSIMINKGNFVIKGDGADKTTIEMLAENKPADPAVLFSSPEMIVIKSPTTFDDKKAEGFATVTGKAVRGSRTVKISSGTVSANTWVALFMKKEISPVGRIDDPAVMYDLEGHHAEEHMLEMIGGYKKGKLVKGYLKAREFHYVESVSSDGKTITFKEPIMRDVDVDGRGENWVLKEYSPIEEIGIEDLTFKGHSTTDFVHHASWRDDGAFKPLQLTGVANSWIRRVNFECVSEAATFAASANCSAYEINITGNRGHSGIRSNGSSRIFLGNINETSTGKYIEAGQKAYGDYVNGAGQYHASGVSKQSIGAVLWRNHWGSDATFESHSSQPRATLVDCCSGGWVEWRFGGANEKTPNHLRDLTLWNFCSERFYLRHGQQSNYFFWDNEAINIREGGGPNNGGEYWRVAPPIVVGFHGHATLNFNTTLSTDDPAKGQLKYYEATPNDPGNNANFSLYEAQLQQRQIRDNITLPWLQYLQSDKRPGYK